MTGTHLELSARLRQSGANMRRLALIGVLAMNWMSTGFGGEIDFVEDFVLAKDRAAVLKQLVPGTEEFSYYHALH